MDDGMIREIQCEIGFVKEKISKAAQKFGRDAESVRIIVVTKGQPLDVVDAAIHAGAKLLGENYAEEAVEKINTLTNKSEVEWHMIGHVQSRKTNLIAMNFSMVHSVDSLKLANRLEESLRKTGTMMPVLLEFNTGGEETKYGWQANDPKTWDVVLPEIDQIVGLTHLKVSGLMTMPPYNDDPEKSRSYFKKLVKLRDHLAGYFKNTDLRELSMGTSSDYEVAVEEGATYVRIGQAILGKRGY